MTDAALEPAPGDAPAPLWGRIEDALARTPPSEELLAAYRHASSVSHFRPRPVGGLRELPLGAGEGTLLEHPTRGTSVILTDDELAALRRMDGEKPVMELLYDDMASTGTLALERVAGLVGRLKRAGMLEGEHAVAERLERLFDRRGSGERLLSLARSLRFLPLLREVGAILIALLAAPASLLQYRATHLALGVLALSGAWPAIELLRRDALFEDRVANLFQVATPVRSFIVFAVAAWAVHWMRQLARVATLAAQGVPGAALDIGLSGGLPVARVSDATRRRSGRARTCIALRGALLFEAAVAAAAAWVADQMFAAAIAKASALTPPPYVAPREAIYPAALAAAAALWTFLDLCPFTNMLGARLAEAASGLEDLRGRALSWLLRRLPRRLHGGRTAAPAAWAPPAEGGSPVLDEPPARPEAAAEERWYFFWNAAAALWLVSAGALALVTAARVIAPLWTTARTGATSSALLSAAAFVALLAAPVALRLLGLAARAATGAVRGFGQATVSLDLSLYVPLALAVAVGVPLAAVLVEPDADRLASVAVNVLAAIACPVLAFIVRREHRGSRLASALTWLGAFFIGSACAIPLWLERLNVLPPLGDFSKLLIAVHALSYFFLFPFFLFTFLQKSGRWVALAALVLPFLAAPLYVRASPVFLSEPGIRFLAVAGPASFAVLAFFTMFGFLDTPLTAFWAFLAASLGLEAWARWPALAFAMEPSGREELAFALGVRGIAGLLAIAALGAHRLAFRRLRVPDAGQPVSRVSSESAVLVDGFVRFANSLLSLLTAHLGASRTALAIGILDTRVRTLDVPLVVDGDHLAVGAVDDTPIADVARRLRKVAGELLRGVTYLAGEDFLRRALRLTHGGLYWVERELLSYWVFEGIDWGQQSRPITGALDEPSRTDLLARIPLFGALSEEDLADLAFRLRRRDASVGEVIVKQGEPGHEFFVILEGQVEVLQEDAAGVPRHLATLGAQDCFGELALLEGVPRTATVRALAPTVLLTLSEADFRRLLAATPEAAERVVPLIRFGGFLARVPLFADLPPAQLLTLALRLRADAVEPGTVLVHEGEPGDRFYLVREGTLEVTRDGRPLGRLGPGEYFGEIALLTEQPRVATVAAVTPAVVLSLGQQDFYAVLKGFLGTFRRLEEFAHRRLYLMRSEAA